MFDRSEFRALKVIQFPEVLTFSRGGGAVRGSFDSVRRLEGARQFPPPIARDIANLLSTPNCSK